MPKTGLALTAVLILSLGIGSTTAIFSIGLVAVGLVPGIPAALAAGQGIASFLYGVAPLSIGVLLIATAVVAAAAIAAALGPAIKAARIDPIEALRD